jgi:hypothetical protein
MCGILSPEKTSMLTFNYEFWVRILLKPLAFFLDTNSTSISIDDYYFSEAMKWLGLTRPISFSLS